MKFKMIHENYVGDLLWIRAFYSVVICDEL